MTAPTITSIDFSYVPEFFVVLEDLTHLSSTELQITPAEFAAMCGTDTLVLVTLQAMLLAGNDVQSEYVIGCLWPESPEIKIGRFVFDTVVPLSELVLTTLCLGWLNYTQEQYLRAVGLTVTDKNNQPVFNQEV